MDPSHRQNSARQLIVCEKSRETRRNLEKSREIVRNKGQLGESGSDRKRDRRREKKLAEMKSLVADLMHPSHRQISASKLNAAILKLQNQVSPRPPSYPSSISSIACVRPLLLDCRSLSMFGIAERCSACNGSLQTPEYL